MYRGLVVGGQVQQQRAKKGVEKMSKDQLAHLLANVPCTHQWTDCPAQDRAVILLVTKVSNEPGIRVDIGNIWPG